MRNGYLYSQIKKEVKECELCGSKRGLEIHHIIPISLIPDGIDVDFEENLVCICRKCHAILTPKSLLTRIGLKKAIKRTKIEKDDRVYKFYEELNEMARDGCHFDVEDVLNVFDEIFTGDSK